MTRSEWIPLGLAAGVVALLFASRSEAKPKPVVEPPDTGPTPNTGPTTDVIGEANALALKAEVAPATVSEAELARIDALAAQLAQSPGQTNLAARLGAASLRVRAARAAPPGPNPIPNLPNLPNLPNIPIPTGTPAPGMPAPMGTPAPGMPAPGTTAPAPDERRREPPPIIRRWQVMLNTIRTNPLAVNMLATTNLVVALIDAGFPVEARQLATEAEPILRPRVQNAARMARSL